MRYIYIVLCYFVGVPLLFAQTSNQQEAIKAYSEGNYEKSIELYEKILHEEGEAPVIYYNLGNAYYKDHKIGKSILNYERALLLLPNYADAKFNLEFVQSQTVDKIETIPTFFMKRWVLNLQHLFSSNTWVIIGVILFFCFIGGISVYFFVQKIVLRKVGFYVALSTFVLCLLCNIFAYREKQNYLQRDRAVVMEGSVSVKSTPDKEGSELFLLHEGTLVRVKNKLGEWKEIEIADGNVGWIEEKSIEII